MTRVAFDIDGTLIKIEGFGIEDIDTPRYDIVMLLFYLASLEDTEIYVWSGGGIDYAKRWVEKLGLYQHVKVIEKGQLVNGEKIDLVFDDEEVELGKVNIRV